MTKKFNITYCFCCDKKLECEKYNEAFPEQIGIVYDATFWVSYGNYGSRIYDPMSGDENLEIVICDECLKKAADKKRVRRIETKKIYKTVSCDTLSLKHPKKIKAYKKSKKEKENIIIYADSKKMMLRNKGEI